MTDGTVAGTVLLKDICPGAVGYYSYSFLGSYRGGYQSGVFGKLWLVANDGTSGYELWTTDGTEAGTSIWSDFNSGMGYGVNVD